MPAAEAVREAAVGSLRWQQPSKEEALAFFDRFSFEEAMQLVIDRKYDHALCILMDGLCHFREHCYRGLVLEDVRRIDAFTEFMLHLITREDMVIPDSCSGYLVTHTHLIANIVAMSSFRTTDPQLRILLRQKHNFVRLLMLHNPRNSIRLDPTVFFGADPKLTSLWYMHYPLSTAGLTEKVAMENLQRHFSEVDERLLVPGDAVSPSYFFVTNVLVDNDRLLKEEVNRRIGASMEQVRINNTPNPKSVAIITSKWFNGSAVYKSLSPFVYSLRDHYDLTLVHLGAKVTELDETHFKKVLNVTLENQVLNINDVMGNDFQVAYFPDIGMSSESIWLSNLRLAPIQAVGYGHPVSTFGSKIDYFIGGVEAEVPELADRNYSERLVLLPGVGAHPVFPDYTPRLPARNTNRVTINCPWGCAKFNYPMLQNLRRIRDQANRPVHFQFFPAWGLERYNAVVPFVNDLGEIFGPNYQVVANRLYPEYMAYMEYGDLSVDSYPFGGYNTIVDSLYLGKPIVTYEGTRFFNKAASALLRRLGLEELVAHNDDEYVEKTLRLVNDDMYRLRLSSMLRSVDLKERLFGTNEPEYFRKAIDHLIANHAAIQSDPSRAPIFIN